MARSSAPPRTIHQRAYRAMQSPVTSAALESVSPGMGILPALLAVVGSLASSGLEIAKPWISGASKGEARVTDELAKTEQYRSRLQSEQAAAQRNKQLAMLGAGVLIVGGVAYYFVRSRKRGGGKWKRRRR